MYEMQRWEQLFGLPRWLLPAVMVMLFAAASGLLNLFTPTSGVVMGGMAMSGVEYRTWLKCIGKVLGVLLITNVLILTAAMLLL